MKQRDRKPLQFSSAGAVRLKGYGRRSRQRSVPWLRLGAMALIVLSVAVVMIFRHLPRGAGEAPPLAAAPQTSPASALSTSVAAPQVSTDSLGGAEPAVPASSSARPNGNAGGSQASGPVTPPVTKALKASYVLASTPNTSADSNGNARPPVVQGAAGRRYHVQIGAAADKAGAEELARQLRALGYAVRVVGAQPYLVWVGGYLDEPTAERLLAQLRGQGFDAVLNSQRTPPP